MEPLFFDPDYKERVWGGQRLKEVFGKEIPYEHTGESWEIASHDNGHSQIRNGTYAGWTLKELLLEHGPQVIGRDFQPDEKFPLLVKFIDAKDKLSVQVHPEDDYARINENGELGKSEAWYVLKAEPGAELIAGLKEGTDKETFKKALEEERLGEVLNYVPVKKGDVIDIPAGLIHAIGNGILLAEVQQNSDTTYRVYDWGRVGLDGNKRELHVDKSLDVIDFEGKFSGETVNGIQTEEDGYTRLFYLTNDYFKLEKLTVTKRYQSQGRKSPYEIYICTEGKGRIQWEGGSHDLIAGDSLIIPSGLVGYTIEGEVSLLRAVESE